MADMADVRLDQKKKVERDLKRKMEQDRKKKLEGDIEGHIEGRMKEMEWRCMEPTRARRTATYYSTTSVSSSSGEKENVFHNDPWEILTELADPIPSVDVSCIQRGSDVDGVVEGKADVGQITCHLKRHLESPPVKKQRHNSDRGSKPKLSSEANYKLTNLTESLIAGAKASFYSISRLPGVCYASDLIAIGKFDQRGGMLKLRGEVEVFLRVPPNAVKSLQLLHIALQYEPFIADDGSEVISPVIDCGPNGSHFQVPLELTFPHDALDTEVFAVMQRQANDNWTQDSTKIKRVTEKQITILVDHFTRFKLLRKFLQSRKHLRVTVYKSNTYRKAKVYFMNGNSLFEKVIDEEEALLGYKREDTWKEFHFVKSRGGLHIRVKGGTMEDKEFLFPDDTVMRKHRDSWDFVIETDSTVEIIVTQPRDECMITQFCLTMKETRQASTGEASTNNIMHVEDNIIKIMTSKLEPHPDYNAPHVLGAESRGVARNIWDKTAVEPCDHYGGNCGCFNDNVMEVDPYKPIVSQNIAKVSSVVVWEDAANTAISQPPAELTEKPKILKGPESLAEYDGISCTKSICGTVLKDVNQDNHVFRGEKLSAVTTKPITVSDESTLASQARARENNNAQASSFQLHLSSVTMHS